MAGTKNLCAQIDLELHCRITETREQTGQTTSQYITELLTEYFNGISPKLQPFKL